MSVRLNLFLLSQPQVWSLVNLVLFLNSKVVFHLTRFLNLKYCNSVMERELPSARVSHSKNFKNDFQHFFAIVFSSISADLIFCFHFWKCSSKLTNFKPYQPIPYLPKCSFVSGFAWTDGSSPVQIKDISLSPHPVILRKGAKVTFSGMFKVESAVGMNYKIDVKLKRQGWWGTWIPIPCFGKW